MKFTKSSLEDFLPGLVICKTLLALHGGEREQKHCDLIGQLHPVKHVEARVQEKPLRRLLPKLTTCNTLLALHGGERNYLWFRV